MTTPRENAIEKKQSISPDKNRKRKIDDSDHYSNRAPKIAKLKEHSINNKKRTIPPSLEQTPPKKRKIEGSTEPAVVTNESKNDPIEPKILLSDLRIRIPSKTIDSYMASFKERYEEGRLSDIKSEEIRSFTEQFEKEAETGIVRLNRSHPGFFNAGIDLYDGDESTSADVSSSSTQIIKSK